jgi:hypothetical protein
LREGSVTLDLKFTDPLVEREPDALELVAEVPIGLLRLH